MLRVIGITNEVSGVISSAVTSVPKLSSLPCSRTSCCTARRNIKRRPTGLEISRVNARSFAALWMLQSSSPMDNRMSRPLAEVDPEIYDAIRHETERQNSQLELIASENFTSEAVLEATASVLTNKYAEGYPGKRYYGGCEFVDVVENLARERAKKIFGAEYVNVQPHSG